jgi:hypothetical protein
MTTQYKLQKDVAGYNGFGLQFCDQKYSVTLAASTDTTVPVPLNGAMGAALNSVNKWLAVIQVEANLSVWFALNATAEVPAGATFALTNSDLIIGSEYYGVEVKAGDVMHFLAPTAGTDILVKFYALPAN